MYESGWRGWLPWVGLTVVLGAIAGAAASQQPATAVLVVVAVVLLYGLTRLGANAPVLILLVGLLLTRPTILGGTYTTAGVAITVAAAVWAVIYDRGGRFGSTAATSLILWLTAFWLWALVLLIEHPGLPLVQTLKGFASVVLAVAATAVVASSSARRAVLAKLLLGTLLVVAASGVITYLIWAARGPGAMQVGTISNSGYGTATVYFPFSVAGGDQLVAGTYLPRFFGICREPAFMAALFTFGYFLLEQAGWQRRRWMKLLMFAGLLLTVSTTGIVIFIVTWLIRYVVLSPDRRFLFFSVRVLGGIAAMIGAYYLVTNLPFVGIEAKSVTNASSITERYNSGVGGLTALFDYPWGYAPGLADAPNAGINLIAAIVLFGAPGFFFALMCFLRPVTLSTDKQRAFALVLPLLLTALLAEPVQDAPLWWILVLLACSGEPESGEVADGRLRDGRRDARAGHVELQQQRGRPGRDDGLAVPDGPAARQ